MAYIAKLLSGKLGNPPTRWLSSLAQARLPSQLFVSSWLRPRWASVGRGALERLVASFRRLGNEGAGAATLDMAARSCCEFREFLGQGDVEKAPFGEGWVGGVGWGGVGWGGVGWWVGGWGDGD